MSNFKKYPSLENHTNAKFIEKCFEHIINVGPQISDAVEFVAREKIHGTNFSIIITKDAITPAKRSGEIKPAEKFFGYEDLMADLDFVLKKVQKDLNENLPEFKSLQIFGEYAGPGIQKEVNYGDIKSLYVFDVYFDCESAGISHGWWPDSDVQTFCSRYGLKIAPLIARGPLTQLLKLPVEFESVVPTLTWQNMYFEHKQLPSAGNPAEGLVIKPNQPMFLHGGSRLAIKYKTDAFKEKSKGKLPKIPTPLPPEDLALLEQFNEFVTWNRVSNVISHIGEVTSKDFGKVLGLTMRDIFVEAEREGIVLNNAQQPSKFKAELQKLVQAEIRTKWLEVIS